MNRLFCSRATVLIASAHPIQFHFAGLHDVYVATPRIGSTYEKARGGDYSDMGGKWTKTNTNLSFCVELKMKIATNGQ
jgi:hypothetical protein